MRIILGMLFAVSYFYNLQAMETKTEAKPSAEGKQEATLNDLNFEVVNPPNFDKFFDKSFNKTSLRNIIIDICTSLVQFHACFIGINQPLIGDPEGLLRKTCETFLTTLGTIIREEQENPIAGGIFKEKDHEFITPMTTNPDTLTEFIGSHTNPKALIIQATAQLGILGSYLGIIKNHASLTSPLHISITTAFTCIKALGASLDTALKLIADPSAS